MKLNFLYIIAGLLLSLVAVYFISHGSDGVLIIPVLLAAGCFSAYLVGKRTYGSSSVKHIILPPISLCYRHRHRQFRMEATDGIAFPIPRSPFSENKTFALDVTKSLHYSILVMWAPRA